VLAESDAAVISASMTDPERFGVIFDRHATVLFRYLVRRVGADEADALLGELFRVAFEKRTGFDLERPSARPWLYGIATNLLAHHHRSETRRLRATAKVLASRNLPVDSAERVDEVLDASVLWPTVARGVAELPQIERDVVVLYVWEELSYQEIASALGVAVGTIRSRLNRARMRLRELSVSTGRQI
jgi:RNA polymerase sigma-70 factor (ECF subfamily)